MGTAYSTFLNLCETVRAVIAILRDLSAGFNQALNRASQPPGQPKPNPTASYWLNDPPFPHLVDACSPKLPQVADVAVIGSGIAGAAITRSLLDEQHRRDESAETKVVVLEARQLCSGATGRNGGHIKVAPYEAFSRFSKSIGKDRAAALVRFQMQHVDTLIALCQRENIHVAEARKVETVDLFLDSSTFDKAVDDVKDMKKWLPEVEINIWNTIQAQKEFDVNESIVGALSYQAGAMWAYRFTVSIWNDLLTRFPDELSIETNTAVESITVTGNGPRRFPYAVETGRGVIHVRHVVHATNAFASQLVPGLRNKIVGARAHMTAQQPAQQFPDCAGSRSWSVVYGTAFDYVTQRPSASDSRPGDLMLGGGFTRSLKQGIDQVGLYDDGAALDGLTMAHLMGIFPSVFAPRWGQGAEIKQAWSGIIGLTGDNLPLVGRLDTIFTGRNVPNKQKADSGMEGSGEWIAAGFSGEGMVWAWLTGTALGIMIAGGEDDGLPEVIGRPGGALKQWLPREVLVSSERLRSADISRLANQS